MGHGRKRLTARTCNFNNSTDDEVFSNQCLSLQNDDLMSKGEKLQLQVRATLKVNAKRRHERTQDFKHGRRSLNCTGGSSIISGATGFSVGTVLQFTNPEQKTVAHEVFRKVNPY